VDIGAISNGITTSSGYSITSNEIQNVSRNGYLGLSAHGGTGGLFKGMMKDVSVYNKPLERSDITDLYNQTALPGGVIACKYVSVKDMADHRIDSSNVSINQSGKATFDVKLYADSENPQESGRITKLLVDKPISFWENTGAGDYYTLNSRPEVTVTNIPNVYDEMIADTSLVFEKGAHGDRTPKQLTQRIDNTVVRSISFKFRDTTEYNSWWDDRAQISILQNFTADNTMEGDSDRFFHITRAHHYPGANGPKFFVRMGYKSSASGNIKVGIDTSAQAEYTSRTSSDTRDSSSTASEILSYAPGSYVNRSATYSGWLTITVTLNESGKLALYADGVQVDEAANTNFTTLTGVLGSNVKMNLGISESGWKDVSWFQTSLKEVYAFNKVLSLSEIKDLANSKAPDMSSVVFADESKLPYSLDKDLKFTLRHLNKDSLQKVITSTTDNNINVYVNDEDNLWSALPELEFDSGYKFRISQMTQALILSAFISTDNYMWPGNSQNLKCWLDIEYPKPRILHSYSIRVGTTWFSPTAWHIYGSNDNENWEFIDAQGDPTLNAEGQPYVDLNIQDYDFSNNDIGSMAIAPWFDTTKKGPIVPYWDHDGLYKGDLSDNFSKSESRTYLVNNKFADKSFKIFKIHFWGPTMMIRDKSGNVIRNHTGGQELLLTSLIHI
jgi:hypothetical protein